MSEGWPISEVDPVARLRALAAAIPHSVYRERTYAADLSEVWGLVEDFERAVPRWEGGVDSIQILHRDGEKLDLLSRRGPFGGIPLRFDAILRRGWCVMSNRWVQVGMAAAPVGGGAGTRFAHFEALRVFPLLAKPWLRRNVEGDLERLARELRPLGSSR